MKRSILIVAGEPSGDIHGADVVRAVHDKSASISFWGVGGDELAREGVELLQRTDRMSVMGLAEVLKSYRFLHGVFHRMLSEVDQRRPDAALLIDYPWFNLRLAAKLKKRGVPVYYYISPKVWAWNKFRIAKMARVIDRLMVIFPFEQELFKQSGLRVDYVGNPLVEQIERRRHRKPETLEWGDGRRIALLPGSRRQEIERILPVMLKAACEVEGRIPQAAFTIAAPNDRIGKLVEQTVESAKRRPAQLGLAVGKAQTAMMQAEAALVTSGTATLETALIGTPHLLVYKTSATTYWFAKSVLNIKHIGLVNILAQRTVCPEILQHDATPQRLAQMLLRLLEDSPERVEMLNGFNEIRQMLGIEKSAEQVASVLLEPLIRG